MRYIIGIPLFIASALWAVRSLVDLPPAYLWAVLAVVGLAIAILLCRKETA